MGEIKRSAIIKGFTILDFAKAFDTLEWMYIYWCLKIQSWLQLYQFNTTSKFLFLGWVKQW